MLLQLGGLVSIIASVLSTGIPVALMLIVGTIGLFVKAFQMFTDDFEFET